MASIRTAGLTKDFGDLRAVNEIDLDLPEGGVAGFVGPNGAGKSTTIRMLLGLIQPTSGDGEVLGHPIADPPGYLHRVGALIEAPAFYPTLTGQENLRVFAALASAFHEVLVAGRWGGCRVGVRGVQDESGGCWRCRMGCWDTSGGWRAVWRDPCRGWQAVGVAGPGQQRSGRARSRANAWASSAAQGQEACSRRMRRRAWRTMRAAMCSSR